MDLKLKTETSLEYIGLLHAAGYSLTIKCITVLSLKLTWKWNEV